MVIQLVSMLLNLQVSSAYYRLVVDWLCID